METVEVVIRLKKERYDELQKNKHLPNRLGIEKAITDGTALPKGHGRLVDENTIAYTEEEFSDGRTYMVVHPCDIEDAPTIIEADKEAQDETDRKG